VACGASTVFKWSVASILKDNGRLGILKPQTPMVLPVAR
jgi:hypothetical protein